MEKEGVEVPICIFKLCRTSTKSVITFIDEMTGKWQEIPFRDIVYPLLHTSKDERHEICPSHRFKGKMTFWMWN